IVVHITFNGQRWPFPRFQDDKPANLLEVAVYPLREVPHLRTYINLLRMTRIRVQRRFHPRNPRLDGVQKIDELTLLLTLCFRVVVHQCLKKAVTESNTLEDGQGLTLRVVGVDKLCLQQLNEI